LTGLRITAFGERAAALFSQSAEAAQTKSDPIPFAGYRLQITGSQQEPPVSFTHLLTLPLRQSLTLHFLTPTAFRRGPRRLHLPLATNVFDRPATIWQTFAPASICLPSNWVDWCEANVYAQEHNIRTIQQTINAKAKFTGFVGRVRFASVDNDSAYLQLWQALGLLASYCGVGAKTGMGMGAVAWKRPSRKSEERILP
jgi:CRISPR-associated endoribonuclease Cas6